MKKIITIILVLVAVVGLVACYTEVEVPVLRPVEDNQRTAFEVLNDYVSTFTLEGDLSEVRNAVRLPRRDFSGNPQLANLEIQWHSSHPGSINQDGNVSRPAATDDPLDVTLTGIFMMEGSQINRQFGITIMPEPANVFERLAEDVEDLVFFPYEVVFRDFVILPRVADSGSFIEWETSNPNVIDLYGNVTLPNPGQPNKNVVMTAIISRDGVSARTSFDVEVEYRPASVAQINVNDPRILRRVDVNNRIEFIAAMNNALPGDAIVLASGTFEDIHHRMLRSGTSENPIFIFGDVYGGTRLSGERHLHLRGNHIVLANIHFVNGWPATNRGVVHLEGNHMRMTNTFFDHFDRLGVGWRWVSSTGQHHEFDRNTFDGKQVAGALLTVWRDDTTADFVHIHSNIFSNYADGGGANEWETIRIGTSHQSQSDSHSIVENNLFYRCDGEIEIISLKAGRIMMRNNQIVDSMGHFTLRHGKNNHVIGNVFLQGGINTTGAIRLYDGGHVVRDNYIYGVHTTSNSRGAIVLHSGINIPWLPTVLNAQWTPYNTLIEHNTILNSTQSILFCGRFTFAPRDIHLAYNLIVAASNAAAARFDETTPQMIGGRPTVTFVNELWFSTVALGSGAAAPSTTPTGITFSSVLPTLQNIDGLYFHATNGARVNRVALINEATIGVTWRTSNLLG
jgi:poly(beta-D-mannuronate) lyase